jgi:hypothetical protein
MPEGLFGFTNGGRPPIANPGQRRILNTDGSYSSSPFNSGKPDTPFNGPAGTSSLPVAGGVGDWLRSEILAVVPCRRLTVEVAYNAHASTTTGFVQVMALLSSYHGAAAPLATDDVWFAEPASDGSLAVGATTGVMPSGSSFTKTFTYGVQTVVPLIVKVGPATTNSDKGRVRIPFDVTDARWFMLLAREAGDATNPGNLSIGVVAIS